MAQEPWTMQSQVGIETKGGFACDVLAQKARNGGRPVCAVRHVKLTFTKAPHVKQPWLG
jgi:hypothetical protein